MVVQALEATGTATVHSRRLPAEQVVWLVIGMALFRSVPQARARLGPDPMEWLFTICAEHRAHASVRSHDWRGLALYGVDGTTLRVPDSRDNAGYFGYSHSVRVRVPIVGCAAPAHGAAIALARHRRLPTV